MWKELQDLKDVIRAYRQNQFVVIVKLVSLNVGPELSYLCPLVPGASESESPRPQGPPFDRGPDVTRTPLPVCRVGGV